MNPVQILDCQAEVLAKFTDKAFEGYVSTAIAPMDPYTKADLPHDVVRQEGKRIANIIRQQIRYADAYHVTPDMTTVLIHAANKLDETDRWDHHNAPSPYGFVRFDKPLPIRDVKGKQMLAHWLIWGPAPMMHTSDDSEVISDPGTYYSLWNDTMTEPDEVTHLIARDQHMSLGQIQKRLGRWGSIGGEAVLDGGLLGPIMDHVNDQNYIDHLVADGVPEDYAEGFMATNAARYVHALWLLLGQSVTTKERGYIPHADRRRIGRMPIPGRVTVVALRRMAGSRAHGETLVEWAHRWVVKGHWRWQRYGPGRTEQRRIWIAPFIKGPEDKPFIMTRKVYDLKR
jgi:hypothetical protein